MMQTVEPPVTPNPNETPVSQAVAAKPSLKERFKSLMADYGRLAIWVYFTIFFATWAGFALAIHLGFQVEGAGGTTGTIAGGYVAAKVTQPVRIFATLGLTPPLERVLRALPKIHRFFTGRSQS
ncbi:hypothetical protein F0U60_03690 [Archangium minus]|uniref:DUF1279 domain-containing protein n=1 Tax=Archangium minus TaxID=83450 RepID=A0ABY9WI79_9BACT|nr:hypothetical protein F0U60_03690 [Archangium minus]